MLAEACFVWNHALALQKRYYRLYGNYIQYNRLLKHFCRRIPRKWLNVLSRNYILFKLDKSYKRFFQKKSNRPPKFKKKVESILFQGYNNHGWWSIEGCKLENNYIWFRGKINKKIRLYKNRNYEGKIKRIILKHNRLGEYFICVETDAEPQKYGKSHNGASVGIDFGLKTYLTLSDGTKYENPQFMKESLTELRRRSRNLSKCKKGSNNHERKCKELIRLWNDICNKRDDFQWKLAHELCRKYDTIFIENLNLLEMSCRWGRKIADLSHSSFVQKLIYIATKYDVVVHKIDRFYPSSKTCTCGYVNKGLKLSERKWTCPHCGAIHDRDLLAANNILRQGLVELERDNKTLRHLA